MTSRTRTREPMIPMPRTPTTSKSSLTTNKCIVIPQQLIPTPTIQVNNSSLNNKLLPSSQQEKINKPQDNLSCH